MIMIDLKNCRVRAPTVGRRKHPIVQKKTQDKSAPVAQTEVGIPISVESVYWQSPRQQRLEKHCAVGPRL